MKTSIKRALLFISFIFVGFAFNTFAKTSFDPGKAEISTKINDTIVPYREFAFFVMPFAELSFEVVEQKVKKKIVLTDEHHQLVAGVENNRWNWNAPGKPGLYQFRFRESTGGLLQKINIFVMVPYSDLKGEYLNGYRIGTYPNSLFRNLAIYKPPSGFIEVTAENSKTKVSPHFTLEQFLSKQESRFPKYLVLKEELVLKLELILQNVNQKGIRCDGFVIMSGYRTPFYNKAIGNVKYSRHLWGGAADIYIDENPKDQLMDDLNNDGELNYKDAAILYDLIDEMYGKSFYATLTGGLSHYRKTRYHGPFVHIDVRGFRVRWGL